MPRKPHVLLLVAVVSAALAAGAGCDKLRALGIVPLSNTPAAFADVIRAEAPYWARLIRDAGIKQIE